jgi:hypothetical protein
MISTGIKPKHIVAGLTLFAIGLFLLFENILYCVEFIKGGAQPVLIFIGLAAAAAAVFPRNKTNRTFNILLAIITLMVGGYGTYDEYYATMDFLNGIFPLLLIVIGFIALTHGIARLKK